MVSIKDKFVGNFPIYGHKQSRNDPLKDRRPLPSCSIIFVVLTKEDMKKAIAGILFLVVTCQINSQDLSKFNLYKPSENAEQKIAEAVKLAKQEHKHVFIQIGGNWCIWCARFNDFTTTDPSIDSLVKTNYVVYHMNYSKENYNARLLAKYGYPQRFGFPVFLVLDGNGKLIHTQNSGYLEDGNKSYKKESVTGFFTDWSPAALNPKMYTEK
jgi:thioredoxin-related protein